MPRLDPHVGLTARSGNHLQPHRLARTNWQEFSRLAEMDFSASETRAAVVYGHVDRPEPIGRALSLMANSVLARNRDVRIGRAADRFSRWHIPRTNWSSSRDDRSFISSVSWRFDG
jgi:hypothetical protein